MNDVLIITIPGLHPDTRLLEWWSDAYAHVHLLYPFPGACVPGVLPDVLSAAWPLSAAEARAYVEHAAQLAATMESGALKTTAAQGTAVPGSEIATIRQQLAETVHPVDTDGMRRQAHQFLLLACMQEQQVDALRSLAHRYQMQSGQLRGTLAGEGPELEPALGTNQQAATAVAAADDMVHLPFDTAHLDYLLPAWQRVLERMSMFFPEGAALCTAHPEVLSVLTACAPAQPVADCPSALAPLAACRDVRLGQWKLPLWRVCGLNPEQGAAARPWLHDEKTVYGVWHEPLPDRT